MPRRPVNVHPAYHAHVYFDAPTVEQARALVSDAWHKFYVSAGRLHQKEVGPHPRWSCQIGFDAAEFDKVIPWLEANRNGLDILVHGDTGDDLKDHTDYAYWLGQEWPLKLEIFRRA
ncbi:DOPA 4,5-dioxygenase family protein [Caenimonas aquaedulcis]|uniref:DOPA 4,5-dioxygenase family protein n=1 Tax=Caenimonas aquaedulcis TaxID=2793270 RepID=A0A931H7U6_9BURK|nr:DOPA 4,5-dioxygenase family protein [Caenimonas aquaedulcis]MBG9390306.1 DOPA 4,5-dioxygenase family protein [Caenimonas aquaedulcis]